ncbi:hypothetical protein ACFL60_05795 [Candidatus Omnitrophota bacterium]
MAAANDTQKNAGGVSQDYKTVENSSPVINPKAGTPIFFGEQVLSSSIPVQS